VAGPNGTVVQSLHLHGDRVAVRERSVLAALDLLRRYLLEATIRNTRP
jgi:nicotinamide mononucleotide (NMN) deamidase PncC